MKLAAAGLGLLVLLGLPVSVVLAVLLMLAAAGSSTAAPGALSDEVPEAYRQALIAAAASCPGLSAPLLAAQLATESGWNPDAVSPAGAQGLAQFVPGTWATWGRDGDCDGEVSVWDPLDAIAAQGAFMCDLLARAEASGWGDPVELAAAGYNAGWGAVRTFHGVPPFTETRTYVDAILALVPRYVGSVPSMPLDGSDAVLPVADPDPITNGFGNRPAGIAYELGYHTGVDFNANRRLGGTDYGEPVVAARAGVVYAIRHGGPLGLEVVIGHPDGHYTSSGHLASATVHPSQQVLAGQQIGTIGCSGMSTCGPHLHFEVRRSPAWAAGNFVDPLAWLAGAGGL